MKVCSNGPGRCIKMAVRSYMVKNKNLLLQNQKTDYIGICYVKLGVLDLPSLFKNVPDLPHVKVKFAI